MVIAREDLSEISELTCSNVRKLSRNRVAEIWLYDPERGVLVWGIFESQVVRSVRRIKDVLFLQGSLWRATPVRFL